MEISSKNEHPGEEILLNNATFTMKINPTPYEINHKIRFPNCTIYLFLCPLFATSLVPLTSSNDNEAPFAILPNPAKICPAFMIYQGTPHFGFRISSTRASTIELQVRITLRPLVSAEIRNKFEVAQFLLFCNMGNMKPLDVRTIVIHHRDLCLTVLNLRDKQRPTLPLPLPYYQSPTPYTILATTPSPKNITPEITIAIGSPTHLFIGDETGPFFQLYSVTPQLFHFHPQLSFPAMRYLIACHENGLQDWFDETLCLILLHYDMPHITTILTENRIPFTTQMNFTFNDMATQTDAREEDHDEELNNILDELFNNFPMEDTVVPQV